MNRSLRHGWVVSRAHGLATGASIALLDASLASAAPSSVLYSTEGKPQQGALVVALHLGNDVTYCSRLGGTVLRDISGIFVAKDAPAPATCPLP